MINMIRPWSGILLWAILFCGVFDVAYVVIVAVVIIWIIKGQKKKPLLIDTTISPFTTICDATAWWKMLKLFKLLSSHSLFGALC